MTTIAYKDGVIATDGQTTSGSTIVRLNTVKMRKTKKATHYCAGSHDEIDVLVSALDSGAKIGRACNANSIMVKDGSAYLCGEEDGEAFACKIEKGEFRAIGSGWEYAMGAMAAGCSAKQAVKIAASLDIYTGGKIRTYKV